MTSPKHTFTLLIILCMLSLVGCSNLGSTASTAKVDSDQVSSTVSEEKSAKYQLADSNDFSEYIRVSDKANEFNTSEGRIALALVICKLDNSKSLSDLSQKDAETLFQLLRETATQKSITLETIDKQYYITDILQSEGIHESIQSNNVTALTESSPSSSSTAGNSASSSKAGNTDWVPKFEKAINS